MCRAAPPQSWLRHRNIVAARQAYDTPNADAAIEESKKAHGMSPIPTPPVQMGVSAWVGGEEHRSPVEGKKLAWTESGHNDELTHRGTTLLLRSAVEGLMLALSVLSLGQVPALFDANAPTRKGETGRGQGRAGA